MSEKGTLDQTLNYTVVMLKGILYVLYTPINFKKSFFLHVGFLFGFFFKQKVTENVMPLLEYLNVNGFFPLSLKTLTKR